MSREGTTRQICWIATKRQIDANALLIILLVLLCQLINSSDRPIILNHRNILHPVSAHEFQAERNGDEQFLVDEFDRKVR